MVLAKNVAKTLATRWMQLVAIGLIVVLSSLLYTAMSYALGSLTEPTEAYLRQYVQEDFSVEMMSVLTSEEAQLPIVSRQVSQRNFALAQIRQSEPATFQRLIDNRVAEFEDAYPGTSLELRQTKTVEFERGGRSHTALVARDAEHINLSFIESGAKPQRDNEIALNRVYAQKNGIDIGDLFVMLGRRYLVTGYVLFPDYTLTTFDNSLVIDTGLQALVLLSNSAFDAVDADAAFRLAGISPGGAAVDTAIDRDRVPFVTQIIPTNSNMRSGAIYSELTQGRTTSLGLSIFIAAIAVVIVSIMMSDLLGAERGQIGILKALGYRRNEVARPYFVAMMALALVMLILGYVLGVLLADPLKRMYLDFYLLPQIEITQTVAVFTAAVFVPLLFFAVSAGAVIFRMLSEGPLALLQPREVGYVNTLTRWMSRLLSRAKGSTRFKYLHAVRNTGSFIVFFVGIMFSTLLILYALMMNGMVDRMTVGPLENLGYRYQAIVDPTKRTPDPRPGDERFLLYPYAYLGEKVVTLHGLEPGNALTNLHDEDGRNITNRIRDNAVITKSLALKRGLERGDRIGVRVNDRQHEFTVAGVAAEYSSDTVYLNISTLSGILTNGESTRLYSGIYSIDKPSPQFYRAIVSKQGMIDQSRTMANYTTVMINSMILTSALIAASILFVLTSFTVERNYYPISLLKVLGYSRTEVNSMILNSYFVYSLIAFALSVPLTLVVLRGLVAVFLRGYGLVLPLEFDPLDALKALAFLVVIFVVGTHASRRKIARIPLQEVLKTYAE